MAPEAQAPVLPVGIVGLLDVGRLIRELEKVEALAQAATIRSGEGSFMLPKLSPLLDQLAEQNRLDFTVDHQRQSALAFLKLVKKSAPRVHMSFSANPSAQFIATLMLWLRQNIHPHLLVAIGLQPGIGAGCMLRTTNRYFDMSLSQSFGTSRELLMKRLRETVATPEPAVSSPGAPA